MAAASRWDVARRVAAGFFFGLLAVLVLSWVALSAFEVTAAGPRPGGYTGPGGYPGFHHHRMFGPGQRPEFAPPGAGRQPFTPQQPVTPQPAAPAPPAGAPAQ